MADLRSIVRSAYVDLERQVAPLARRRDQLAEELAKAERELSKLMPQLDEARKVAEMLGLDIENSGLHHSSAIEADITIKEGVRLVLHANCEGLNSADLHSSVSSLYFGDKLERTSFSPQLSRMKSNGEVVLEDNLWRLTAKGASLMRHSPRLQGQLNPKQNEPHDAGASHGSETGSDEGIFS